MAGQKRWELAKKSGNNEGRKKKKRKKKNKHTKNRDKLEQPLHKC